MCDSGNTDQNHELFERLLAGLRFATTCMNTDRVRPYDNDHIKLSQVEKLAVPSLGDWIVQHQIGFTLINSSSQLSCTHENEQNEPNLEPSRGISCLYSSQISYVSHVFGFYYCLLLHFISLMSSSSTTKLATGLIDIS